MHVPKVEINNESKYLKLKQFHRIIKLDMQIKDTLETKLRE